jgi:hypothetical protein
MPKISKSELLRALTAAEAGRPASPGVARVPSLNSPKLTAMRRATEAALRPVLVKAGFNDRQFVELRKQHGAELKRVAEHEQAAAVRRSPKIRKTLRAGLANKIKALGTLANLPAAPFLTIIDRPFLIWAKPRSNIIWDSHIGSGDSWAKVKAVGESGDKVWGTDTLSFYFLWDNPTPYYAVIDAATFITFNGFARAHAEGSFWGGIDPSSSRYSYLSMWTSLTLWQWSDNPPTPSGTPSQNILSLSAEAGFFEDTETSAVSGSSDHSYTHYVVNPSGVIVFEVSLAMSYSVFDGHTLSDFSDGSYEVSCPYMVVGLLSAPPVGGMATSGAMA